MGLVLGACPLRLPEPSNLVDTHSWLDDGIKYPACQTLPAAPVFLGGVIALLLQMRGACQYWSSICPQSLSHCPGTHPHGVTCHTVAKAHCPSPAWLDILRHAPCAAISNQFCFQGLRPFHTGVPRRWRPHLPRSHSDVGLAQDLVYSLAPGCKALLWDP